MTGEEGDGESIELTSWLRVDGTRRPVRTSPNDVEEMRRWLDDYSSL